MVTRRFQLRLGSLLWIIVPLAVGLAVLRFSLFWGGLSLVWFVFAVWRTRQTLALRPDLDGGILSDEVFGIFVGSLFYAVVCTIAVAPLVLAAVTFCEEQVNAYRYPPGDKSGYPAMIEIALLFISIPWLAVSMPLLHLFNKRRRIRLLAASPIAPSRIPQIRDQSSQEQTSV